MEHEENLPLTSSAQLDVAVSPRVRLAAAPRERTFLAGKSWVAYVKPTLWAIFWIVLVPIWSWRHLPGPAVISAILGLSAYIYRILWLESYRLYMDEYGVTLEWGILPWAQMYRRVQWRDIESCGCPPGFLGWLLGHRSVFIWQRYTGELALFAGCMAQGSQACSTINSVHLQWVEDRSRD